jgi:hypothetical protein
MLISDAIGWFFLVTMVIVAFMGASLVDASARPSFRPTGRAKARIPAVQPSRPSLV